MFVQLPTEKETGWLVPALALGAALSGAILAIFVYRHREADPINLAPLRKRFYFDELYSFLIRARQELLARLSAFLDRWILDGTAVRGASTTTWGIGSLIRLFQVKTLPRYAFL